MKSLVVYDSQYGNTEKVSRKIAEVFQNRAVPVSKMSYQDFVGLKLLVSGSPTQRLTATPSLPGWIDSLPIGTLDEMQAAAFDTRFTQEHITSIKVLPCFVRVFGYAAGPIARRLRNKRSGNHR
jgi:flavodoxin